MTTPKINQLLFARQAKSFHDRSSEEIIRELADREEIRDLTSIYAHRVAHGLANADLFTDDGAYIQHRSPDEAPQEIRGRKELNAHYIERPDNVGIATPMIHNHLIEVNGDEAQAVCSIELRIAGSTAMFASGYYEDRLRREAGQWKFVERTVTFFRWGPL